MTEKGLVREEGLNLLKLFSKLPKKKQTFRKKVYILCIFYIVYVSVFLSSNCVYYLIEMFNKMPNESSEAFFEWTHSDAASVSETLTSSYDEQDDVRKFSFEFAQILLLFVEASRRFAQKPLLLLLVN